MQALAAAGLCTSHCHKLSRIRFKIDEMQTVLEIEADGCGFILPPWWVDMAHNGNKGLLGPGV